MLGTEQKLNMSDTCSQLQELLVRYGDEFWQRIIITDEIYINEKHSSYFTFFVENYKKSLLLISIKALLLIILSTLKVTFIRFQIQ